MNRAETLKKYLRTMDSGHGTVPEIVACIEGALSAIGVDVVAAEDGRFPEDEVFGPVAELLSSIRDCLILLR